MIAAGFGCVRIVESLLNRRASVEARDKVRKETCLLDSSYLIYVVHALIEWRHGTGLGGL